MSDQLRETLEQILRDHEWDNLAVVDRLMSQLWPPIVRALEQERDYQLEIRTAALAEKDAQIAALQQRVDDLWDARTTLRETPAPPEPTT